MIYFLLLRGNLDISYDLYKCPNKWSQEKDNTGLAFRQTNVSARPIPVGDQTLLHIVRFYKLGDPKVGKLCDIFLGENQSRVISFSQTR